MERVVTLCEDCSRLYSSGYSVKKINFRTKTEKLKYCENCKRKNQFALSQYIISKKGG